MRCKVWVCFSLIIAFSLVGAVCAVDRDILAAAAASITASELKNYVDVLADDTFEGRETGSRGVRAAGNYVLKEVEKLGATPIGEGGSYVQSFHAASRNILGLVEGSDPRLKDQYIVIGAHYDHVGFGNRARSPRGRTRSTTGPTIMPPARPR